MALKEKGLTRVVQGVLAAALLLASHSAMAQTLRMWTFLDPNGKSGREVALKQMIEKFETANPGVKIQVEPQIWQQMGDKFLAAHQTGTAPDVIWVVLPKLGDVVAAGALANLDELFIKNWSAQDLADVNGAFFQYKSEPGKHFQLAGSRSIFGMCYRADLLKEAGVDPNTLKSWDNFIAAAQKLQQTDANGNVTRWGFAQSFVTQGDPANIGMSTIVHLEGSAFNKDGKPTWATPAGVKGLQLYVDMVKKYKITPGQAVSMSSDDVYDQFTAGRAVFARCSSARVDRLASVLGDKGSVDFLPTPSFKAGEYSPTEVSGWPMGVWSKSKNKEMAGKFIEYLGGREADELWVKVGGQVPMRQSTIDKNKEFFAAKKNAYMVATAAAIKDAGWFPPDNAVGGKNDIYLGAVQDAITNNTPPLEALKKAEAAYIRANRL